MMLGLDRLAESTIKDSDYAFSQRQQWDSGWQSLADYTLPSMGDFTSQVSPGQARNTKIVNSTGLLAARECAVRVSGFLMGEGSEWFDLRIPDSRVEEDRAVQIWLEQLKQVLYGVFNSPGSGFGVSKEPTMRQLVVFGNAPVYCGEDRNGFPKFRPAFLGNCAIWNDDDNRPVALYREYPQTAWGLEKQFGAARLPQIVRDALDKEPQKTFTCIHAVRPRRPDDPFDIAYHPWIEIYVLKDKKHLLRYPSGYWENPWLFPRWNVSPDESYGRGPGGDALPDVKMLQKIDTAIIKHASKNVDPPFLTEDEAGVSPRFNNNPGAINYGRMNANGHWNIMPLPPGGSAADADNLKAEVTRNVKSLFYLDAFKMVEKISEDGSVVHMSATEFSGRLRDQMQTAGPALERMRAELLAPMLARSVAILLRNRKVPPPPWQLRGSPIHPEYVSPLAVAQRAGVRNTVLQFIGDITPLAAIDPRTLDAINAPRTVRVLGKAHHVPQAVLNSREEAAALQKARADAQVAQQQMEQMAAGATASKETAQAVNLLQEG